MTFLISTRGKMTTLDKNSSVSTALALQLEGQAIMAEVSAEEYLQELLDKFGHKALKSHKTEKLQEYIRLRNSEGANDTQIAREKNVSQQLVSRHRKKMGLPQQARGSWNKKKHVLD